MVDKCKWPISDSEEIEFDIHDVNANWLNAGCVYIFARQTEDGWLALYVGQAKNAKEQLTNHPYLSRAVQIGATHIHARLVPGQMVRDRLVNELVAHLEPPMNAHGL